VSGVKVYHGCHVFDAAGLLAGGRLEAHGLWVAPTRDLAARYAAARATGVVDPAVPATLPRSACVLTLEVPGRVEWWRRPAGHASLDRAEAKVYGAVRVVAAELVPCDHPPSRCDAARAALAVRAALEHGPVTLAPAP
jgi:hypothetical protein